MSNQPLLIQGRSEEELKKLADSSIDSCVTDPPYELGFMGRKWDKSGIAYSVALWKEVFRTLRPGSYLVAFGGTRTYHRMACAIEDAGFDIRDQLAWIYASGFPKSHNFGCKCVGKNILEAPCGANVSRSKSASISLRLLNFLDAQRNHFVGVLCGVRPISPHDLRPKTAPAIADRDLIADDRRFTVNGHIFGQDFSFGNTIARSQTYAFYQISHDCCSISERQNLGSGRRWLLCGLLGLGLFVSPLSAVDLRLGHGYEPLREVAEAVGVGGGIGHFQETLPYLGRIATISQEYAETSTIVFPYYALAELQFAGRIIGICKYVVIGHDAPDVQTAADSPLDSLNIFFWYERINVGGKIGVLTWPKKIGLIDSLRRAEIKCCGQRIGTNAGANAISNISGRRESAIGENNPGLESKSGLSVLRKRGPGIDIEVGSHLLSGPELHSLHRIASRLSASRSVCYDTFHRGSLARGFLNMAFHSSGLFSAPLEGPQKESGLERIDQELENADADKPFGGGRKAFVKLNGFLGVRSLLFLVLTFDGGFLLVLFGLYHLHKQRRLLGPMLIALGCLGGAIGVGSFVLTR